MAARREISFSVAGGKFTEDEENYLQERGLKWEDSQGELFDISTDVEDGSILNQSRQHSLILFEENEKLYYCETKNGNSPGAGLVVTPSNSKGNVSLPIVNPLVFDDSESLDEDEDKENKMIPVANPVEDHSTLGKNENRLSTKSTEIESSGKIDNGSLEAPAKKDVLAEIPRTDKGSSASSPILTLNVSYNDMSLDDSMDNVDVVPCTQNMSLGECERTGSSLSAEEYVDFVPCTQQQESIMEDSQLDISSVPCSQVSATSSKDDLDDTIATMTKLLALADEQEAKEKLNAKNGATEDNVSLSDSTSEVIDDNDSYHHRLSNIEEVEGDKENNNEAAGQPDVPPKADTDSFKTPLKHARLKLLKRKHLYTPSPPRTHVDELLQKGLKKKTAAVVMNKKCLKLTPTEDSPANTSTPKRNPLNNITPLKKVGTSTSKLKTPVTAKVDSGLRAPPFAIGLSPVANYIYSKPAPSTFVRVTGIPNPNSKASNNATVRSSATRIPVPPSRASQVKTITPGSSSKEPKTHSVLRTSTFFNNCTPPKIILNEKSDTKRFQPMKYTGTPKVKVVGKVETPRDGYLAQRHTGLRDDSGNASFIQNTYVQKQNIPLQSRLVTPQSISRKK